MAYSATSSISKTYTSNNNTLKIGNNSIENVELLLFDMSQINKSLNNYEIAHVAGVIGGDILNQLNVCINYKKNEISLEF